MKALIKSIALASIFLSFISSECQAQIFGKVLDRTADIFVDKLEDDLTNRLARHLAERAYRPVGSAFDTLLNSTLPKGEDGKTDWSKSQASYEEMFGQFDASEDVPDSYTLDVKLISETKDFDGEKHENTMYFSKDGSAFGIADEENLVIMDALNDIVIMYDLKEMTAQAIKGMMTLGATMPQLQNQDDHSEGAPMVIVKTGKRKKIIDYWSEEYKGESEEEKVKFYLSTEFPVSWSEAFGPFLQKFAPQVSQDNMEEWDGMVLKSETEIKGTKKKTSYEAKKVDLTGMILNKADFTFQKLGAE